MSTQTAQICYIWGLKSPSDISINHIGREIDGNISLAANVCIEDLQFKPPVDVSVWSAKTWLNGPELRIKPLQVRTR